MSGNEPPEVGGTSGRGEKSRTPPSWLGWGVRLFSVAALLAIGGLLLREALRPDRPPAFDVMVQARDARPAPEGGVLVPVRIENRGTRPVRNLKLEVGPEPPLTLDVDLVGSREKLDYVLHFDHAPADPRARIVSYEQH